MRWAAVVLGVAVLLAVPTVVARIPAGRVDISAQELLARVAHSAAVPYSGYAESVGGLTLPAAEQLSSLTDLFGDTTRTRSWWRGPDSWRVDTVTPTGERDLYRDSAGTWAWDFEANTAVRSRDLAVRLPRAADLVPAALGRRLLSEAEPAEVHRLPTQRVAGRDAPGLQLRPADPRSTISAVDVWADARSGVPLRVLVHTAGEDRPTITTSFLDFSIAVPEVGTTSFRPPPGATVRAEQPNDLISAAQRLTNSRTPPQLAGLARRDEVSAVGGVGAYGRGVTAVVAVALPGRTGRDLRTQLSQAPTARTDIEGVALTVGPLNIQLTTATGRAPTWLLAGTVTPDTLTTAATTLAADRGR